VIGTRRERLVEDIFYFFRFAEDSFVSFCSYFASGSSGTIQAGLCQRKFSSILLPKYSKNCKYKQRNSNSKKVNKNYYFMKTKYEVSKKQFKKTLQ